jgi:membrane fusion protein, copper/silver efflux system
MKTFFRVLFVRLRFVLVFVVVGLLVGNWDRIMNVVDRLTRPRAGDVVSGEFEWFCPMHPTVVRQDPKEKCPICGMPLSQRKRGEKTALPPGVLQRVALTPTRIRQAGVGTEEVAYRPLVREIRTVGNIVWDERKLAHISARIAGRADELFINFAGVRVKKGDPVYKLYSPDLVTTQEEYVLALKGLEDVKSRPGADEAAIGRAQRLAGSAREKLRLWGITDEQIADLQKSGKPQTHLTIVSPIPGLVIEKDIHAGHYLKEGEDPYTVVDDSVVWMQADVFERDMALVREGQVVEIKAEAFPNDAFRGTVAFVAPELDLATRTVKVRVDVPNPEAKLKAGMYVTAALRVPLGKSTDVYYGCCEGCPDVKADLPGKCPTCGMELVLKDKNGAPVEKHAHPAREKKPAESSVYVCEMHPESVWDKPGACAKCGGMKLEERKVPAGSRVVYTCPAHPDVVSDQPGTCPKDGKPLRFQIVSEARRLAEEWICPLHPDVPGDPKGKCPKCGGDMKHVHAEQILAVPVTAVIDTGSRKMVFLDRGEGLFDAVEVVLGPQAGDYYPVEKGLNAKDRVVTAGAFLLDAEARLNPAAGAAYFGASGGGHGDHK